MSVIISPFPPGIVCVQHGNVTLGQVLVVHFTVPGTPMPWARARRAGAGHSFNQDDQTWAGAKIVHAYMREIEALKAAMARGEADHYVRALAAVGRNVPEPACPWGPKLPVFMRVDVYLERPKSSKLLTPCCDRNDWDNYGKLPSDALQGYAYKRDGQIIDGHPRKFYDELERLEVQLTFLVEPAAPGRKAAC